jgi:hypothetical protein
MKSRSIFLLTPVFGAIFGAIIVNAGCASVDVTSMHYLTAPTYAPTAPASIQILNAEPKTAFQRIGEIELSGSSDPAPEEADVEKKLRMAAGKLGADAVLITADRIQPNGFAQLFTSAPSGFASLEVAAPARRCFAKAV